jgi:hypothetical protein
MRSVRFLATRICRPKARPTKRKARCRTRLEAPRTSGKRSPTRSALGQRVRKRAPAKNWQRPRVLAAQQDGKSKARPIAKVEPHFRALLLRQRRGPSISAKKHKARRAQAQTPIELARSICRWSSTNNQVTTLELAAYIAKALRACSFGRNFGPSPRLSGLASTGEAPTRSRRAA